MNNYLNSDFLSLATNFSDVPDCMAVRPRTRDPYYISIWQGENQGGFDYIPISYFKTIDEVPNVASVDYLPEIYRLVYDRFNNREYEGYDLANQQITTDRFKTIVKSGKVADLKDYENPNQYQNIVNNASIQIKFMDLFTYIKMTNYYVMGS